MRLRRRHPVHVEHLVAVLEQVTDDGAARLAAAPVTTIFTLVMPGPQPGAITGCEAPTTGHATRSADITPSRMGTMLPT